MTLEQIMDSEFFTDTYTKIEKLKKDFPVNHGFIHIRHVVENGKHVAQVFNLDEKQTNQLLIACALHDIGYLKGRHDHAKNGGEFATEVLQNWGFDKDDIKTISTAISNHGGDTIECYNDVISRCLILADKLDFVKTRYRLIPGYPYNTYAYFHIKKTYIKYDKNKISLHIVYDGWDFFEEFLDASFCAKLKNCLALLSKVLSCEYDIVIEK